MRKRILYYKQHYKNIPPKNFNDSDFKYFSLHENIFINEISVYNYKKTLVLPELILVKKAKDPFFNRQLKNKKYLLKVLIKIFLRRTKYLKGKYFLVIDDWSPGYFHWMADVLQRMILIEDELKDGYILIPEKFKKNAYIVETLNLFSKNIRYFGNYNLYLQELVTTSHAGSSGIFHFEIINKLRNYLITKLKEEGESLISNEYIYISRKRTPKRKVLNEEEVDEILKKYGFKSIEMEDYPWIKQVQIMLNTSCLIAPHGGGLTNMLFMKDNSSVLELRSEYDYVNNCYYNLASAIGFKYYYQICESDNKDPHFGNFKVDINQFDANIRQILNL